MDFGKWWKDIGQFLNDEIRDESCSAQKFWARHGWEAAIIVNKSKEILKKELIDETMQFDKTRK